MNWADSVDEDIAAGTHDINGPPAVVPEDDFPALGATKAPAPKAAPKKKSKGKTLSLAELMTMPAPAAGPGRSREAPSMGRGVGIGGASEREILMMLPTASRGKVEGETEEPGRLGGAFRDYGGERGGFGARREDRDRRGPRGEDGEGGFMPSRADEVDDWGANRQFQAGAPRGGGFRDRGDRGDRGGFGGDREPRPFSAADTVDSWGSTRKFEPSADLGDRRSGGFGFRDAPRDGPDGPRRGPMFEPRHSRADEEDQWSRGREFSQSDKPAARGTSGSRGFGFSGDRGEQPRQVDAEDRWVRRGPPPSAPAPEQLSQPAERRRLNLAPRTVPASESEPAQPSNQQQQAETAKKSNPFGAARPREEVLKEKGVVATPADKTPSAVTSPAAQAQPTSPQTARSGAEASIAGDAEAVIAPVPVINLETPAERELKQTIESLQSSLEQLRVEEDADDDEIADLEGQIESAEKKLAELQEERRVAEAKAAEALANGELDDSNWELAKPSSKGASKAAPVKEASPEQQAGSKGAGRGQATQSQSGGGRGWGKPSGENASNESRPRPKAVAAGAPGLERKW